jgi:hypothetical protein
MCQVPGLWQCRASDSPKIYLLVRTCVLRRPLEIRRITTVPQCDRSTASFGSHRHGNGLRSNREIVAARARFRTFASFPLATTTCVVYPGPNAPRTGKGNFPHCLTGRTSMLALNNAALARLVIGAGRIAPHDRSRWLRRLAGPLLDVVEGGTTRPITAMQIVP